MSNYTLINDLSGGAGGPGGAQQMGFPQEQHLQQQPQQQFTPVGHSVDQFEMLKKYLDEESDDEERDEEDEEEEQSVINWSHVYGTIIILLLVIIIFFMYKIHFDLHNSQSSVM